MAPAQKLKPLGASPLPRVRLRVRLEAVAVHEPFVALVLVLAALFLTFRPSVFVRSDTWLALVGGRTVWHSWLPRHDTLTVWAHGATWIDQQWLGQLLFYGIDAVGGLRLLLLVHSALILAALGLVFAYARRSGGSSRSVALIGLVGLAAVLPNSAARAQTFAFLF